MATPLKLTPRTEYINLPGDPVKCWAGTDLEVILRKHRDIIFDINFGKADASYTLEANADYFFDDKTKKRIKKLTFKDGEICHIWISRYFKGGLQLKDNKGKLLHTYNIFELDPINYGESSGIKPAPVVFAFGKGTIKNSQKGSKLENKPSVCIVQIDPECTSLPSQVQKFIQGTIDEVSLTANDSPTQYWVTTQVIPGFGAGLADSKEALNKMADMSFRLTKVMHSNGNIGYYIVFKGDDDRVRKAIANVRHIAGEATKAEVLDITLGAGSIKATSAKAWSSAKDGLSLGKKGGILAYVNILLDVVQWMHDYQQIDKRTGKRKKDIADLFAKVGMDIAKGILSAMLASIIVSFGIFTATTLLGMSLPVGVVVVGGIAMSILVSKLVDMADENFHAIDSFGKLLNDITDYLKNRFPKDYVEYTLNNPYAMAM